MEDAKTMRKIAMDLFAGAGGLSQGLKDASFTVVGAIEQHKTYSETYRFNHPDTLLLEKDITQINPEAFMKKLGLKRGELDLLAGCPPCQGYSTIGTRNRGVNDDCRNDLVYEILRFALVFRPRVLMMENVPSLAKDKRLKHICQQLARNGYKFDVRVLNAAHFDVPQIRRRMIMLASRLGQVKIISKKPGQHNMTTVRAAIAFLPRASLSGDPLHNIQAKHGQRVLRFISMVPKDGGSRRDVGEEYQLDCHKRTTGFRDVYGRMAWDRPSPTITGGCNNPSKGRFLHPEIDRAITLREAALLQTFPITYQFSLSSGKQGVATMIGNALPPRFIEFHARSLLRHLELGAQTHECR